MEALREMADNQYDLAIVDPNYGIKASRPSLKPNKAKQKNGTVLNVKTKIYKHKNWDDLPPPDEYFDELIRVSKNQIIWGVNFYDRVFGKGRIVWDKVNGECDQFDCEIAYQSFNDATRIVRKMWSGMFQGQYCGNDIRRAAVQKGNKQENEERIHPTQKPVDLYEWLLINYAKEGDKILDTHLGSGSIAIACHNLGFSLDGYEIDKEYYESALKRLKQHQSQLTMF